MSPKNRERWHRARSFFLKQLQEASTMRGVVYLLASGATLAKPENLDAIMAVALLLVGVIATFFPDNVKKESTDVRPS